MNLILIIALSAVSCNLAQRKLGSQKKQNARKSIFSYWEEQRSKKKQTNKTTYQTQLCLFSAITTNVVLV